MGLVLYKTEQKQYGMLPSKMYNVNQLYRDSAELFQRFTPAECSVTADSAGSIMLHELCYMGRASELLWLIDPYLLENASLEVEIYLLAHRQYL